MKKLYLLLLFTSGIANLSAEISLRQVREKEESYTGMQSDLISSLGSLRGEDFNIASNMSDLSRLYATKLSHLQDLLKIKDNIDNAQSKSYIDKIIDERIASLKGDCDRDRAMIAGILPLIKNPALLVFINKLKEELNSTAPMLQGTPEK
jgi:hypothetical protein